MIKRGFGTLALAALGLWVAAAASQPPGGQDQRPGRRGGPPPRFELGRVLPPQARDELDLTKEQEAEIAKLEEEVKERLAKILTAAQKKKLENLRPGGPPPGGPGRPPEGEGRRDRLEPPETRAEVQNDEARGGIQWFATWESGLREARRTNRPILLVSAAPHCAGVSGIW